jgi:hypothetical protein
VTGFVRRSLELKTPRFLSREEKEVLVRRLEAGERIAALAAETGELDPIGGTTGGWI